MLFWLLLLNSLLLIPALTLPGAMPWLSVEAIALWTLLCLLPSRYRQSRFTITLAIIYSSLAFLVLVDALAGMVVTIISARRDFGVEGIGA